MCGCGEPCVCVCVLCRTYVKGQSRSISRNIQWKCNYIARRMCCIRLHNLMRIARPSVRALRLYCEMHYRNSLSLPIFFSSSLFSWINWLVWLHMARPRRCMVVLQQQSLLLSKNGRKIQSTIHEQVPFSFHFTRRPILFLSFSVRKFRDSLPILFRSYFALNREQVWCVCERFSENHPIWNVEKDKEQQQQHQKCQ